MSNNGGNFMPSNAASAVTITDLPVGMTTISLQVMDANSCVHTCYHNIDVTCLTTPVTYYQDQDMDGYGDPASSMLACSPPEGYVENSLDNCPEIPGLQMDPCDDGNELTVGDYLNENCECLSGEAIPTLSQWGLIILGLCLSIIGWVSVRRKIYSTS